MTKKKKQPVIEETQEICSLCGGHGRVQTLAHQNQTSVQPMMVSCGQCQGAGYIVTKRVTRTVIEPRDDR
jgi:DnaJ-class molecular chaperone